MTSTELNGRIVVVTGGAGGVGSTVSKRWLNAGASVLVVDHTQHTLDAWRGEVSSQELSRVATLATDVTTSDGATEMVSKASSDFGNPPDTLIHLVGGFAAAALEDDDFVRVWDSMIARNLTSAFHCYRAMLPALRARGGGWIVGLSSKVTRDPGPRLAAYAASKAGLEALTTSVSKEVRNGGIHINLIVASTIDTPKNRQEMGADKSATWATPDDIADATMYLCSSRAGAVHGATLEVFASA